MKKIILLSLMSGMYLASWGEVIPDFIFRGKPVSAEIVYDRHSAIDGMSVKVYNIANSGFVVMQGDKMVGYSTEGSFSTLTAPPALIDMLDNMTDTDESTGAAYIPVAPLQSERGPILWNQDSPFNDLCPMYDLANRCPSGCVATAMAQVMYYHQWPHTGTGEHTYSPAVMAGNTLTADFGNTAYKWDAMLPDYFRGHRAAGYTEAESRAAVAQLLLHCGVAVDMFYYTQSGASDFDVPPALVNYFRYDSSIAYRKREHYSTTDWLDIINQELREGRMILAFGRASSGGHAFVFDGMDADGYIHVNWGWGGMSNGYFATSVLTPATQGIGGADGGFNYSQRIITGIKPEVEGVVNDAHVELTSTEGLTAGKKKIQQGADVNIRLSGKITNHGWQDSTFDYALMLLSADGDTTCIISGPTAVTLAKDETGYAPQFGSVNFGALAEGTYRLYPACRVTGGTGEWIRIRDSYIGYPNYLEVKATATDVTFAAPNYFSLRADEVEVPSTIYSGRPTLITANVTNLGDVAYHGEVRAVLRKGKTNVASTTNYIIDLAPEQTTVLKFTDAFTAAPADYTLVLLDDDGQAISAAIPVAVTEAPAEGIVSSVAEIVIESNTPSDLTVKATVKVETGDFYGLLYAFVYSADGHTQRGSLFPEYIALCNEGTAQVSLHGCMENGEEGRTYLIRLATYNGTSYHFLDDELSSKTFTLTSAGIEAIGDDESSDYIYFDLLGRPADPNHSKILKKLRIKK